MRLGLVTYNMAKDWDIATIIENCQKTGFQGVELRTTHAHGVEDTLSQEERKKVRETFESSDVKLVGLGSAFEFHSTDPEEVKRNIEGTKSYTVLARDVGAEEVKVRPNGLQVDAGIPVEKTLEQIGLALRECGEFAKDYDIEIRLEVHGKETQNPKYIHKIMEVADHENVVVCWNSNNNDIIDGSVKENFDLLKDKIRMAHMRDLYLEEYPWGELLGLFREMDFKGYCLAEIPASPDPIRVMNYYRALWKALAFPRD